MAGPASKASVRGDLLIFGGAAFLVIVGLLVAALQAATQIQDPTISHLPRVLAVAAALALLAPWMGKEIATFAERTLTQAAAQARAR